MALFLNFQAKANNEFNWCMTELIQVRDKIQSISPEAIEIVDGYNDLGSIEHVEQCESQLAEAEGVLSKVCLDREKLNISEGFEVFINKEFYDACKSILKEASFQNELERFADTDPSIRIIVIQNSNKSKSVEQ